MTALKRNLFSEKQFLQAQYTVEAALLAGVILPTLITVLMAGFYLHDKVFLGGICHEVISIFINLREEADGRSQAEKILKERLSGGILWAHELSGHLTVEEDSIGADSAGRFSAAGFAFPGTVSLEGTLECSAGMQYEDPADAIWKIRGARYLLDEILQE